MKKFLSILLAAILLISMVACTPSEVNDGGSNIPTNSTSDSSNTMGDSQTHPDDSKLPLSDSETTNSTPTQSSTWETRTTAPLEIIAPEIESIASPTGSSKAVKRVLSPLSKDAFDLAKIKNSLKQNPLFKDWVFGTEKQELGDVALYSDIGQQTRYRYYNRVVATQDYYSTSSYLSGLEVECAGDTAYFNGYESVIFGVDMPMSGITEETRANLYDAVCAVFGEYADTLFYAPVIQGESIVYEVEFDDCSMTFRRILSQNSVTFSIHINKSMRNSFEYCSEGYEPILGTPEYFFDLFSEKMGPMNMDNYEEIGSQMLKANFDDYTFTMPNDDYSYRVLEADNGHKVVDFSLDGKIAQKDYGKLSAALFNIEYTIVFNGDNAVDVEAEMQCGISQVEDYGDKEVAFKKFFSQGVAMLDYVFDENLNLESELTYNTYEDRNTKTQRNMTLLGLDKKVEIEITFKHAATDTYAGYINIEF